MAHKEMGTAMKSLLRFKDPRQSKKRSGIRRCKMPGYALVELSKEESSIVSQLEKLNPCKKYRGSIFQPYY
jgi:hypothetical protein